MWAVTVVDRCKPFSRQLLEKIYVDLSVGSSRYEIDEGLSVGSYWRRYLSMGITLK